MKNFIFCAVFKKSSTCEILAATLTEGSNFHTTNTWSYKGRFNLDSGVLKKFRNYADVFSKITSGVVKHGLQN